MKGICFFRKRAGLSRPTLAAMAGCSIPTIVTLEGGGGMGTSGQTIMRIADTLGVTVDQLLEDYDDGILQPGDHATYPSRGVGTGNELDQYRRDHNWTYQELADLAGLGTRQNAQQLCRKPMSPKTMSVLAHLRAEEGGYDHV